MKVFNRKLAKRIAINRLQLDVEKRIVIGRNDAQIARREQQIAQDIETLRAAGFDELGDKIIVMPASVIYVDKIWEVERPSDDTVRLVRWVKRDEVRVSLDDILELAKSAFDQYMRKGWMKAVEPAAVKGYNG